MSNSPKCALAQILRQAGLRPSVAACIITTLRAEQLQGGHIDDVAGALLRWKDGWCVTARRSAEAHMQRLAHQACQEAEQNPEVVDGIKSGFVDLADYVEGYMTGVPPAVEFDDDGQSIWNWQ